MGNAVSLRSRHFFASNFEGRCLERFPRLKLRSARAADHHDLRNVMNAADHVISKLMAAEVPAITKSLTESLDAESEVAC